jgi:hypothetical protein
MESITFEKVGSSNSTLGPVKKIKSETTLGKRASKDPVKERELEYWD